MTLNLVIFNITKHEVNQMKLEIFNNYQNKFTLDSENPVLGALVVDNVVEEVAVASTVVELQDYFGIKDELVFDKRN